MQWMLPNWINNVNRKLGKEYPLTKEIINWKLGEPKKGIVDFGHKPDRKYSDIFYREYLPEKWIPQQLRNWYNNPQNYQFKVPIDNGSIICVWVKKQENFNLYEIFFIY